MSGNGLFIVSLIIIWSLLLYHMFLTLGGYRYSRYLDQRSKWGTKIGNDSFPSVSVLIPAHNEEIVIEETLRTMLRLDYPQDQLEIFVIIDACTDKTGEIVESYSKIHTHIVPLYTKLPYAGKGKATALNQGLEKSSGDFIVVYDADNRPERSSLKQLVMKITSNNKFGAVVGKFRVINAYKNLLTRFINIETISFQWIAQAGRWNWFGITTIPGTNFIVRKDVLLQVGGWDERALAEDTELSLKIYNLGYIILFSPTAVTWEQEPETWKVWFKQRTRWAVGNQYVIIKYFSKFFRAKRKRMLLDLIYFFSTYFLFLIGQLISDLLLIFNIMGWINLSIPGPYLLLWVMGYFLYFAEIAVTLAIERTELTFTNLMITLLMYLSYSQIWIVIILRAIWMQIKSFFNRKDIKWDKTKRFQA